MEPALREYRKNKEITRKIIVADSRIKTKLILPAVIILMLILVGIWLLWATDKSVLVKKTAFHMDTYVQVVIKEKQSRRDAANEAVDEVMALFSQLDEAYSLYDAQSSLSAVNRMIEDDACDPQLLSLLEEALDFSRKTGGSFDPTLGGVKILYPLSMDNPVPPDEKAISQALDSAGFHRVQIKDGLIVKPEGLKFDLGGILKGYAVDESARLLERKGFHDFMINGGGDIRTSGTNLQGVPWRIGVEHPRARDRVLGIISLKDQAVATSGDYQRYFFYEQVRFHHLLDPVTGLPARRSMLATVIAPDTITADAFSTAAFVKGRADGIAMLEEMGLEGIIVDEEGISTTRGLSDIPLVW